MSKSISSREAGQSRRRRKENKAVVLCESLRLGPALRDEIVHFFTADHELALTTGMKMEDSAVSSCLRSRHFEVEQDWSVRARFTA